MIKLLLLTASVAQAQMQYSPTLTVLQNEAAKDPASVTNLEDAKKRSSAGFTGEKDETITPPVDPSGKTYIMEGTAPIPGINIYTPKEDPNGGGRTEKPEAKPLINPKLTKGALGLGGALAVGGIVALALGAPVIGAIALFLGGLLLGAGAVLWFIGKKTAPKK